MAERAVLRRVAALIDSRRRWLLLAGFSAGFLAAMGQAPFGFFPATIVGLFAAYGLFRAAPGPGRTWLAGWAVGAGYFSLTLIWIVQPFFVDISRHGWMAPFALFFLAGGLALFWAGGFGLARWLSPGRFQWLGWPVAMSAAELLRGVLFTGFPWGGPGEIWVGTPFMQLAAFTGASGLSFLTFLLASAFYAALNGRRPFLAPALPLAGLAAALTFGLWRSGDVAGMPAEPLMLRVVQPNAPQHLKWHPDHAMEFVTRQIGFTGAPPQHPGHPPDLVIWPETAVPSLVEREGVLLSEIGATAGRPVVLGILRRDGERYYNTAIVIDPMGEVTARYDKHHLVPFGEYVPLGNQLARHGLPGFASQHGYGYSAGPGPMVLDLGVAGKVQPLICYEAIFPRDLRAAPERPGWLLQLTNDAWFGTFSGPQQHLAQARLRAVEMGLPLVRAANTGISAVIDAHGRVRAYLPLGEAGFFDAELPGALAPTLYARFGDAPLEGTLIALALWLALMRRRFRVDPPGRRA